MIRVLLADDHHIVRLGMKTVLELEPDIAIAGEVSSAAGAIAACRELEPDVILLDLRMPGNGHTAIGEIARVAPATTIIVLSTSESEDDIGRAIGAGAAGYLLKTAGVGDIVAALRAAKAGALKLPDPYRRLVENHSSGQTLSPRELEVLRLVAKGLTNREIAKLLCVSTHTAKAHVARILEKMEVADRTEAAAQAIRRGLLDE